MSSLYERKRRMSKTCLDISWKFSNVYILSLDVYTSLTFEEFWVFVYANWDKKFGRCLVNFFYDRELDLCYKVGPPIQASDLYQDFVCPGTELMRIDSSERQDYIKLVTGDKK